MTHRLHTDTQDMVPTRSEGTGEAQRWSAREPLESWGAGPRVLVLRLQGPVKSFRWTSQWAANPTRVLKWAYKTSMCLDIVGKTARSMTGERDSISEKEA